MTENSLKTITLNRKNVLKQKDLDEFTFYMFFGIHIASIFHFEFRVLNRFEHFHFVLISITSYSHFDMVVGGCKRHVTTTHFEFWVKNNANRYYSIVLYNIRFT